jgi:hypothetical protein
LPTYDPLGGPQGKGHVTFDRAQSQYLDAGPRTLNIATNGGLTIVAVVRFTGDPGTEERIIDLASGAPDNNIILQRELTSRSLKIQVLGTYNGQVDSQIEVFCDGVIVQETWMTVMLRYNAATRTFVITVITRLATTESSVVASKAVTDRYVYGTWIGKNRWFFNGFPYFNGDMAGVFVVDEYLSAETASAIADDMVQGVDLSKSELCETGPCVRCEAGTYKRTVGWSSALTLRPRLYVH